MAEMSIESRMRDDGWREVGGTAFIKWDNATTVEGTYTGAVEVNGVFGTEKRHRIATESGEVQFFAPSMLARLLSYVQVGERVKIEYEGKTVTSRAGKPVKQFQVMTRPGKTDGTPF
jgi:hypothetical protein